MKTYTDIWGPFTKHNVIEKKTGSNGTVVLNAMDEYRPGDCEGWMLELVDQYSCFSEDNNDYWQENFRFDNTVTWIDNLYHQIESFAKSFNKQVETPFMRVLYEKPDFQKTFQNEDIPQDKQVDKFFEAHFVTRNVSLLLRGANGYLQAYILPVSMLIGMSVNSIDPNIKPRLELQVCDKHKAVVSNSSSCFAGTVIDQSSIPSIGQWLFSTLIKEEAKMISILRN